MHDAMVATREADRANRVEFIRQVRSRIILQRFGIHQRPARWNEGQFEDFDLGKTAGRIAGHEPRKIGRPFPHLVVKVRRRATKLH
jgi:hypothetical protein